MIDNYLDFVKGMRKRALREAHRAVHASREYGDPVVEAFYRGLFVGMSLESRRWRTLQKDIEAVVKVCENRSPEEEGQYISNRFY